MIVMDTKETCPSLLGQRIFLVLCHCRCLFFGLTVMTFSQALSFSFSRFRHDSCSFSFLSRNMYGVVAVRLIFFHLRFRHFFSVGSIFILLSIPIARPCNNTNDKCKKNNYEKKDKYTELIKPMQIWETGISTSFLFRNCMCDSLQMKSYHR